MVYTRWREFPFEGFGEKELLRRGFWEKAAKDIIELEAQGERVGLVLETGGGKTIIALLVALTETGDRILFLAPQRLLTGQHTALLKKMTGGTVQSRIINGEIPFKERVWDDDADRIIFATPQAVESALRVYPTLLGRFGRIISDEFHKARGEYSYVPIAQKALSLNIKILALSASPGTTKEEIESVTKNCTVTRLLRVEWKDAPKRLEDLVIAEPDENLIKLDALFERRLGEIEEELRETLRFLNYRLDRSKSRIREVKLNAIARHLETINFRTNYYYRASSLIAQYNKLRHARRTLMVESYETFEAYLLKIEKDKSRSAHVLRENDTFKEIVHLVQQPHQEHPKVAKLLELLLSVKRTSRRGIIFVHIKKTGLCLQDKIAKIGLKSEVVFGGKDKSVERQAEILSRLKTGDIDFVISTSVLLEGVSIPEIKIVVRYGMPENAISMIQGSGRTARTETGNVVYLTLNHFLDTTRYWRARSGVRRMKELTSGEIPARNGAVKRRRRKEDKLQLRFEFISEEETAL